MSAPAQLRLDPTRPNHVTIIGRKGSGKSELARSFWDSYPYNRLVIDPTGDVDAGDDAERISSPVPTRWPPKLDRFDNSEKRSTLRFVPDMGADDYVDEMDRAVGLAFVEGRCLLWVDEVGELTSAHSTPPHMRRLLHQSRHRGVSLLACGPRPIDINPLVLSQADYVAAFQLPNPKDRQRVADSIGLSPTEFDEAHHELVDHGFLWWDARQKELLVCPPIPLRRRQRRSGRRFEPDEVG